MKKIIKEIIVVEGRDDIAAVKAAVDAEVIQVNGFAVKKNDTIEKIRVAANNKGIIILTDPDFAGNKIREYIHLHFPNAKDAFITRKEGTKNNDIGVENAKPDAIIKALELAKYTLEEKEIKFNMNDLIDNDLIGSENSSENREKLGEILGIGYSNAKQLLSKLNRYNISRDEFENAIKKMNGQK